MLGAIFVLPISDDNPTSRIPYITYLLIGINIAVFIYELTFSQAELTRFFYAWAVVPIQFTASLMGQTLPLVPMEPPEWITFISSQFLHGGFLHVAGNMLFLWIFGNNVEDQLGHIKYLIFYLSCGILAGLTQWYFSQGSQIPSLGASGAVAGVMGAYIIRFPWANVRTVIPLGIIPFVVNVPAFAYLGIWFLQQAFYSFATLGPKTMVGMEGAGIAYWAHAGGFVFGAILGILFGIY